MQNTSNQQIETIDAAITAKHRNPHLKFIRLFKIDDSVRLVKFRVTRTGSCMATARVHGNLHSAIGRNAIVAFTTLCKYISESMAIATTN